MHSSCLPGFMFVDSRNISASRPTAISSMIPASFSGTIVSRAQFKLQRECYTALKNESLMDQCPSKCYPFTKACCPGHYCPLSRACMIPCHEIGSFCPSSSDDMLSLKEQCFPLGVPKVGPSMGCGGAREEESICPRGYYCPSSHSMHICPRGHFCRAGDNAPTKCSPMMRCPIGTADPQMGPFGILLISILILYLLTTIGYKYIRSGVYMIFEKINGQTYAEWLEKNQNSKLLQYISGLPRLSLSFNSASSSITYSSVKKTIQTAFVSTEGDNGVTIQQLEMNALPNQMTTKDGTEVIAISDDEEEEEEVEVGVPGIVGPNKVITDGRDRMETVDIDSRITRQSALIRSANSVVDHDTNSGEESALSITSTVNTDCKQNERSISTATSTRVLLNSNSAVQFTMDIEFTNLTMKLKSNNKVIVNNVSGRLPPGTITAVMGPSGSGKSSFLSALRGQAPYAKLSGEIKINGQERSILDYADVVGYVPQNDIMSPWLTPREVLDFQADLRLSRHYSTLYRKCVVRDVLELLDIYDIRDSKIGNEKKRGISGGQKKRVNIGMELVAQPSILFLDEPTSGLDATTSSKVMVCLKNIAQQGVTVLVVIHQPRYTIFNDFDNLLLLARGGKCAFMGKREEVIPYFQTLGYQLKPHMNPADFILDVIQGELDDENVTEAVTSESIPILWETKCEEYAIAENEQVAMRKISVIDEKYKPRNTASWVLQSIMAMKRGITINSRQRMTILSDVMMIIAAGFIVGWMSDTTQMSEVPELCHAVILASSLCGAMISLRAFGDDKLIFCRYKQVGISSISYFIGQSIADSPWILFEPILLLFFMWPICFPRGDVFHWFLIIAISMFTVQSFAQLIAVSVDKSKAPLIVVVSMLILCFFNGMSPTCSSMHDNWITGFLIDISFARWQFEALWINEVEAWPRVFGTKRFAQAEYFGWDLDNYGKDIGVLLTMGVVFRIATFIILYRS